MMMMIMMMMMATTTTTTTTADKIKVSFSAEPQVVIRQQRNFSDQVY